MRTGAGHCTNTIPPAKLPTSFIVPVLQFCSCLKKMPCHLIDRFHATSGLQTHLFEEDTPGLIWKIPKQCIQNKSELIHDQLSKYREWRAWHRYTNTHGNTLSSLQQILYLLPFHFLQNSQQITLQQRMCCEPVCNKWTEEKNHKSTFEKHPE